MTDVELSMLQYSSFIHSAKSGGDIYEALERRRAEQVELQRDAHATKEATVEITHKMDEAAESSSTALEIAQKSLKVSKWTLWVAVATLAASIVAVVVAIVKN